MVSSVSQASLLVCLVAIIIGIAYFTRSYTARTESTVMAALPTQPRRLAIFLHGLGDQGMSFRRFAYTFRESHPTLEWHTPTAQKREVTLNPYGKMTAWFDLAELPVKESTPYDAQGFKDSTSLVHSWVDTAIASGIKSTDVYVCGFSQGAALALHSGIRYPLPLGGIIAFAGWMPGAPEVAEAQAVTHTRVLLVHGSHDSKVPAPLSERARVALEGAGLSVERFEFPGDHELGPQAVSLMDSFFKR